MRDGNRLWLSQTGESSNALCLEGSYEGWKHARNHQARTKTLQSLEGSYEGWKLFKEDPTIHIKINSSLEGSYEGWKPSPFSDFFTSLGGLEGSYEGWKPFQFFHIHHLTKRYV